MTKEAGKGSKDRTDDFKTYWNNKARIDWSKKEKPADTTELHTAEPPNETT